MTDKEQKANEFLLWISKENNSKEMKRALAKNITFNSDYFEDIFQDSIIKVYNSIMNGNEVNDFKSYMFITLKFNYIQKDNQIKNRQKQEIRLTLNDNIDCLDESDIEQEVFKDKQITKALESMKDILLSNFSEHDTYLFIEYFKLKTQKYSMGYKELSAMTQTNIKYISNLIPKMKKWLNDNEEMNEIKRKLINDGLY